MMELSNSVRCLFFQGHPLNNILLTGLTQTAEPMAVNRHVIGTKPLEVSWKMDEQKTVPLCPLLNVLLSCHCQISAIE
jgi:hypothetical protein